MSHRLMESSAAAASKQAQGRRGRAALCAAFAAACAAGSLAFAVPSASQRPVVAAQGAGHVSRAALEGQEEKTPKGNEWRMNVGHAIDVLREDVPNFFEQQDYKPDYSIYSDDIEFVDAHMPSLHINGKGNYQYVLSNLQWSLHAACSRSVMQITSVSPPVHNTVQMRWKLDLLPKDVFAPAKDWLTMIFDSPKMVQMPVTVEGYSHYEFDPWSGEIVKHTVDVKNPPTFIQELLMIPSRDSWSMPGVAVPGMPRGYTELQPTRKEALAVPSAATSKPAAFAGATAPRRRQADRAPRSARQAGSMMPQGCEDDFDCNDGKANFPMQCCEMPIFGSYCCDPDQMTGGFLAHSANRPAFELIPIRVED